MEEIVPTKGRKSLGIWQKNRIPNIIIRKRRDSWGVLAVRWGHCHSLGGQYPRARKLYETTYIKHKRDDNNTIPPLLSLKIRWSLTLRSSWQEFLKKCQFPSLFYTLLCFLFSLLMFICSVAVKDLVEIIKIHVHRHITFNVIASF